MTHDELSADLAAHLRGNTAWIVWENVQLGPVGSPRPDLYAIRPSFMHPQPRAYEVKISRADFRRDITSGKWQTYLLHSEAVVFAVPAGLIKRYEVPRYAGLIVRYESGWRHIKRPTVTAVAIPQETLLKLCIDGIERQRREPQPRPADPWLRAAVDRGQLGRAVSYVVGGIDRAERYRKHVSEEAKTIRANACKQAAQIRATATELYGVLGLPEGAPAHQVREAVNRIREWSPDGLTKDLLRIARNARDELGAGLRRIDEGGK